MEANEFGNIVAPLKNKLFRLALRLIPNYEDAEEIVQETLIRLWRKKETIDSSGNVPSFAMKVAKNLCLDKMRSKHYKKNKVNFDDLAYEIPSKDAPIEKALEYKDAAAHVFEIMETLPEKWKILIQLRDVEGLSYAEIQEVTGYEVNVIKTTLSRARKRIKENLLKQYDYSYNGK